jgi:hypothetical protein
MPLCTRRVLTPSRFMRFQALTGTKSRRVTKSINTSISTPPTTHLTVLLAVSGSNSSITWTPNLLLLRKSTWLVTLSVRCERELPQTNRCSDSSGTSYPLQDISYLRENFPIGCMPSTDALADFLHLCLNLIDVFTVSFALTHLSTFSIDCANAAFS